MCLYRKEPKKGTSSFYEPSLASDETVRGTGGCAIASACVVWTPLSCPTQNGNCSVPKWAETRSTERSAALPNEAPVHPKIDAPEMCFITSAWAGCLAVWNARSCAKFYRFKLFAICPVIFDNASF